MFNINKDLDIILITYNRLNKLKSIINDIFSDNSPIKHCDITIINNNSTDGTEEFLNNLSEKYNNVKHIKNKYNIGGNANITRAIEIASKKYFWVLCDDDNLDFTNWDYYEKKLITEEYDIIQLYYNNFVNSGYTYYDKLSKFIIESTFVPSNIYKRECITDEIVKNVYNNIYTILPHLALSLCIINNNKNAKILFTNPKKQVVIQGAPDPNYIRGHEKTYTYIHPIISTMDWQTGFSLILPKLLDNNILKEYCMERILSHGGINFNSTIFYNIPNYIKLKKYDNIMALYNASVNRQKLDFILMLKYLENHEKMNIPNNTNSKLYIINVFLLHKDSSNNYISISIIGFVLMNKKFSLFAYEKNNGVKTINFLFFFRKKFI